MIPSRMGPGIGVALAVVLMAAIGVAVAMFRQERPSDEEPVPHVSTVAPRSTSAEPVQVIGRDEIAALLAPATVDRVTADTQMQDDEPVLGVSLDGEHRAYSLPLLTQHEIANDVLGGKPIAVTW